MKHRRERILPLELVGGPVEAASKSRAFVSTAENRRFGAEEGSLDVVGRVTLLGGGCSSVLVVVDVALPVLCARKVSRNSKNDSSAALRLEKSRP